MNATAAIQGETPFHQIAGTPLSLSYERTADLLITAFEGGSNYWYMIDGFVSPDANEDRALRAAMDDVPRYAYLPLSRTGGVLVSDNEDDWSGETWLLDEEAVRRGLELLVQHYPKHAHDVIAGDFDADTADLFLQLALFGELMFS